MQGKKESGKMLSLRGIEMQVFCIIKVYSFFYFVFKKKQKWCPHVKKSKWAEGLSSQAFWGH